MAVYLMSWIDTEGNEHSKGQLGLANFYKIVGADSEASQDLLSQCVKNIGYASVANTTNGTWTKIQKARFNGEGEVIPV